MSTNSKIHQVRLNEWAIRIADHKSSGLSVTDWCKQNNFTIHQYFYWKRLIKNQTINQMLPDIVPISLPSVKESVPVSPSQAVFPTCSSCPTCACARIVVNGIAIELDSSASEEFIRSLIKAVRYA